MSCLIINHHVARPRLGTGFDGQAQGGATPGRLDSIADGLRAVGLSIHALDQRSPRQPSLERRAVPHDLLHRPAMADVEADREAHVELTGKRVEAFAEIVAVLTIDQPVSATLQALQRSAWFAASKFARQ